MEIKVMENVLKANDAWARENRAFLEEHGIRMFNVIGSPGAGKTAFLEKTIGLVGDRLKIGIIEGDLATLKDAERIQKTGVPVYQINTGTACHLNANLINTALKGICGEGRFDLVFVENIGNLVCPSGFDIGEHAKIAVLSVAEGDDKVEKYPPLFAKAGALVVSKLDLLEYTNFSMEAATGAFRKVNRDAPIFALDSLSGRGFDAWTEFLLSGQESS